MQRFSLACLAIPAAVVARYARFSPTCAKSGACCHVHKPAEYGNSQVRCALTVRPVQPRRSRSIVGEEFVRCFPPRLFLSTRSCASVRSAQHRRLAISEANGGCFTSERKVCSSICFVLVVRHLRNSCPPGRDTCLGGYAWLRLAMAAWHRAFVRVWCQQYSLQHQVGPRQSHGSCVALRDDQSRSGLDAEDDEYLAEEPQRGGPDSMGTKIGI